MTAVTVVAQVVAGQRGDSGVGTAVRDRGDSGVSGDTSGGSGGGADVTAVSTVTQVDAG